MHCGLKTYCWKEIIFFPPVLHQLATTSQWVQKNPPLSMTARNIFLSFCSVSGVSTLVLVSSFAAVAPLPPEEEEEEEEEEKELEEEEEEERKDQFQVPPPHLWKKVDREATPNFAEGKGQNTARKKILREGKKDAAAAAAALTSKIKKSD